MAPGRILVVDDNRDIRAIMQFRLQKQGYEVFTEDDPTRVVDTVASLEIDLVLLDIMMPQMDGFQVLKSLRAKYPAEEVPVIMLTASNTGEDVVRSLSLGANDFATKGEQWAILMHRVAVHLGLRKTHGQMVGPYRLDSKIGSGAMGVVYRALDTRDETVVAVKVLPRSAALDESYVQRFLQEAQLASRVKNPNVVHLFQVGRYEETYYLAMELVDGSNLRQRFGGHPMEVRLALGIAIEVLKALRSLREAGVTHRDIKPENIILSEDGRVMLTDFGIALDEHKNQRITSTGYGVGSPAFAAPEQLEGHADFRSDIYSLGATLFWMLTGRPPYQGNNPRAIYDEKRRKVADPRKLNRTISNPVAELVMAMMHPDPGTRPSDYNELVVTMSRLGAAEVSETALSPKTQPRA